MREASPKEVLLIKIEQFSADNPLSSVGSNATHDAWGRSAVRRGNGRRASPPSGQGLHACWIHTHSFSDLALTVRSGSIEDSCGTYQEERLIDKKK
jgi:hypothetical protein